MVQSSGAPAVRRVFRLLPLVLGLALVSMAAEARAQEGTVRVEENLRTEPAGEIIARLSPGMRVVVDETEGSWSRVTIEGYVWSQSLQVRTSGSYDLVVATAEGENLRSEPAGPILGRLNSGTLLDELARIPGWIQVRRTAWMWTPSLTISAPPATGATAPSSSASAASASVSGGGSAGGGAAGDAGSGDPVAPDASDRSSEGWVRSGADGTRILETPDGEVLGRIEPGADLRIVAREGNWARVQLDGWAWIPLLPVGGETLGDPTILRGVEVRDLSANFDRYRGRLVEVDLQFISLERAEQVRSDFYPGEPFLLTRALDQERTFVYVAIPEGRLAEVRALAPLERIRIVGRARSGAAVFTGSPILDLLELSRAR